MHKLSMDTRHTPDYPECDCIPCYIKYLKETNADLLEALDSIINAEHRLGHGLTCTFCIDKAQQAIEAARC